MEKKIKNNESEIQFKGERKYTEQLKIHKEEERAKLMLHIDGIEKPITQTADSKSDIGETLRKENTVGNLLIL